MFYINGFGYLVVKVYIFVLLFVFMLEYVRDGKDRDMVIGLDNVRWGWFGVFEVFYYFNWSLIVDDGYLFMSIWLEKVSMCERM